MADHLVVQRQQAARLGEQPLARRRQREATRRSNRRQSSASSSRLICWLAAA